MLSRQLEVSLRLAVSMARQKRHEFLTVEHLLLALLDNDSAVNAKGVWCEHRCAS